MRAELRIRCGVPCARKRVGRLMHAASYADAPHRLWLTDVTKHPASDGKVYLAAVLDVYARRIVGWSIAGHLRAEPGVDALEIARWRRRAGSWQTVVHLDRGAQYTWWASGHRLRDAGLLGSMDQRRLRYDNAMMESFLDHLAARAARPEDVDNTGGAGVRHLRTTRRSHTSIDDRSPVDPERCTPPRSMPHDDQESRSPEIRDRVNARQGEARTLPCPLGWWCYAGVGVARGSVPSSNPRHVSLMICPARA